jgi:hypothetical protein
MMENRLNKDLSPRQETNQAFVSPTRRSCWVSLPRWFLWFGFALFALFGWVRMLYAILDWYWLDFSGIRPGPLYLVITGGLWGLVALAALIWIVLRRPWYRLVGLGAALFLALTYWIDRLFISTSPGGSSNTLFAALLTLLLLAYVALVLRPFTELRFLLHR